MHNRNQSIRRLSILAMLTAVALMLSYFERFIPMGGMMPGMKLGLANIVTLIALMMFGFLEVLVMVLLRVVLTALITGSGISFFYSLAGGLLSFLSMYVASKFHERYFSMVGISVVGSAMHNTGQMLVLGVVIGSMQTALWWYPYLLVAGLGTGIMTGLVAMYFYQHYKVLQHRIR